VKVTVLPTGTKTPGAASLSVPLVSLTRLIAGMAPKWLSGLVSVTGGVPGIGVPAGVTGVPTDMPTLVYGPAVAMVVAVYVQVSPTSSRPSPSVSPPWKTGITPRSSVTTTVASGTLPGLVTT
jgi:hypothetical protein